MLLVGNAAMLHDLWVSPLAFLLIGITVSCYATVLMGIAVMMHYLLVGIAIVLTCLRTSLVTYLWVLLLYYFTCEYCRQLL